MIKKGPRTYAIQKGKKALATFLAVQAWLSPTKQAGGTAAARMPPPVMIEDKKPLGFWRLGGLCVAAVASRVDTATTLVSSLDCNVVLAPAFFSLRTSTLLKRFLYFSTSFSLSVSVFNSAGHIGSGRIWNL